MTSSKPRVMRAINRLCVYWSKWGDAGKSTRGILIETVEVWLIVLTVREIISLAE